MGVRMISLDNLSSEDLVILTNMLALSFSKDRTPDEINVLGNFIVGVGCIMLTIASQEQYLSSKKQSSTSSNEDSDDDPIIE